MKETTAYDLGYVAGYADWVPDCPYNEDTQEFTEWWEGYNEGFKNS